MLLWFKIFCDHVCTLDGILLSSSSLKVAVAAEKIKQQLDDAGQRLRRVHQEWEEREHLLSHCIQGHALQIDCKKVCPSCNHKMPSIIL